MKAVIALLLVSTVSFALAGDDPIGWHQGNLESAFELARQEHKPLFLYWGAAWCPPCNQIKATIFTRRDFIEKTKLFVPVYLDGDTDHAQIWGEKLDVAGYPTMIVMNSQGKEVMRMPTGLQVEEFARVLDAALERLTPIHELLHQTLSATNPSAVPARDYKALAFHSWGQDQRDDFPAADREASFRALAGQVPSGLPIERSRLFLLWLGEAVSLAEEEVEEGPPFDFSEADRRQAETRLREILASPDLSIANLETLTYSPASWIPALHPTEGPAREALTKAWLERLRWIGERQELSVDERLSVLIPEIELQELKNGDEAPIDADLGKRILARVHWADEAATDPYNRQAAMSTAGYLLRESGQLKEAREFYLAELEKSKTPHYFMSSLSTIAKTEGKTDEAVMWLARAYETSAGRATRFQWGTNYLLGLMDLTPEDGKQVRDESLRVFQELLGFDDAFSGRNHARIKSLASKFGEWNADGRHAGEISALRDRLQPECARLSDEAQDDGKGSWRQRCTTFFVELGKS